MSTPPPTILLGRPDTVATIHMIIIIIVVVVFLVIVAVPQVDKDDDDDVGQQLRNAAGTSLVLLPRNCWRRDKFISWAKLMVDWFMAGQLLWMYSVGAGDCSAGLSVLHLVTGFGGVWGKSSGKLEDPKRGWIEMTCKLGNKI